MADINKNANINVNVKGDAQAKSKLGKLGNFIKSKLVITMGDLVRAGKAVISVFTGMSKAASIQEDAITELNQALKNQGIYSGTLSQRLRDQASALQLVTKYGDEAIIGLQAQFINFGISADRMDDVTKATLDLATAQKMSLQSAGMLLAKSLGSSTNAMARYGIEITGAVGSTERLDTAVKNISAKWGGQAKKAAETFRGETTKLSNAMGDLQETLGEVSNKGLNPLVVWLNKATVATDNWLKGFFGTGKEVDNLEFKIRSLKSGIESLDKKFDPFGGYSDAIAKRKELLAELEEQLTSKLWSDSEIEQLDKISQKQQEANNKRIKDATDTANALVDINKTASDSLMDGEKSFTQAYGDEIKKRLTADLDAWAAKEVAKNIFNPFGIAMVLAAQTAGKTAISAVKFAQGGQFETQANPQSYSTTSGQGAVTNEKGIEIHKVEAIGKSTGGGSSVAPIVIMLGQKELKRIAVDLKPYLNAVDRGII